MSEDLYDQITLTLLQSELTYAISLMRDLGRKGQLEGHSNAAALKLPINAAEFRRIINSNPGPKVAGIFEKHDEDVALQILAVDKLKEKGTMHHAHPLLKDYQAAAANDPKRSICRRGSAAIQGSELVYFNDQADKGYREQTEMVYGIVVDRINRRVMVVFRGSRSPADWAANRDFHGISRPNPVKGLAEFANDPSLPDEVYIHKGFDEYLHRNDGTEVGVFENLMPLLRKHDGFSLWVTGHSLGGGLASLFAVSAACRDDTPKPVCCITHAQPLVGDARLLQSVRKLEEGNHLLLLRTRTCNDGVPAVPAFSPKPNFTYTHIGMELMMYDEGWPNNIKLSKSEPKMKTFILNFKAMMVLFVIKAGKDRQKCAHSLREHLRLLELHEDKIRTIGFNLEEACSKSSTMNL